MGNIRILSGGIAQESHSFNPIGTARDRFTIQTGQDAVQRNRGANSTLGGILDAADEIGAEVIIPTLFRAQSGGLVDDAVFDEVCGIMVEAARKGDFDAIVLPLHGGMATPNHTDPEGHLFKLLRDIVGPKVPITAAFDLHAYVTPDTISQIDFLAAYLTNPHGDQAATSRRAFRAATDILAGKLDPACGAVFFPMLTLGNDRTDEEPLQRLHGYARELVQAGEVYDISIFNAQQFLDLPNLSQAVLVYTNGNVTKASSVADDIAKRLWDTRDELVGKYPSLEESLALLGTGERRVILGDQGDRVAGGGPGDSTFVLNHMLESGFDRSAIVPIYDPEAVTAATSAGVGSAIELTIGGRFAKVSPPVTARFEVINTGDQAIVVYDGPADQGTRLTLGKFAVVRIGKINVLLTAQPYAYIDPAYFRAVGLDPEHSDAIVVRSGYHFSLNFARLGKCITIDTPGMTSYYVDRLPWKVARPFYPVDKIDYRPTRASRTR